jgi:hypothetical protein
MNGLAPPLTILVATVVATWCVLAWRRAKEKRRRWRNDLCPQCGYDVRENKVKCPECGRPIDRFPVDNSAFTVPREREKIEARSLKIEDRR